MPQHVRRFRIWLATIHKTRLRFDFGVKNTMSALNVLGFVFAPSCFGMPPNVPLSFPTKVLNLDFEQAADCSATY